MNEKQIESIDKLVLAVDPATQGIRLFAHTGFTITPLEKIRQEVYEAVEGISKPYSLADLKKSSYAQGLPIKVYTAAATYYRTEEKQQKLWSKD